MPDYKRLIIDIAPALYDELHETADERGITVPELLRRAIALDRYIWEHRGIDLLVRDDDGVRELDVSEAYADRK